MIMDDMNDFGCDIKAHNAKNNSVLRITWTTMGHQHKALYVINMSGL